jgi:transcription elongation factor Elf1
MKLKTEETIYNCPMCGSSASLHSSILDQGYTVDTVFWVKCDDNSGAVKCGTTQPSVSDRDNALARWNRRAD